MIWTLQSVCSVHVIIQWICMYYLCVNFILDILNVQCVMWEINLEKINILNINLQEYKIMNCEWFTQMDLDLYKFI